MKSALLRYRVISLANRVICKKNRQLFFYDDGLTSFNEIELLHALQPKLQSGAYKAIFYTSRPELAQRILPKECRIISESYKGLWAQLRSRYVFVEQNNHPFVCAACHRQMAVQLWHGIPIKRVGYLNHNQQIHPYPQDYSYVLAPSAVGVRIMQQCFHYRPEQMLINGYPRCDALQRPLDAIMIEALGIKPSRKLVLWMPTFRAAYEYRANALAFPLLDADSAVILDEFLHDSDIQLVIKPHALQRKLGWFYKPYRNLHIIESETLCRCGILPYELLASCDALITDFSSTLFDYLLCDRPVIFTTDDEEAFSQGRGFIDETFQYMRIGPHVATLCELKTALMALSEDSYRNKRESLRQKMNASPPGQYCTALLAQLGLGGD